MKRLPVLVIPALTLVTLSACTPVARGTQADFPVEQPDALTPTTVLPGQTVFVTVPYGRAAIEDDTEYDRYFDAISFDYSGVRSSGDKVPDAYVNAPWFTLKSVDGPAGITVTLMKANIGRVVSQTKLNGSHVNVKYGERFRLHYKVSVAADYKVPVTDASSEAKAAALSKLSPELIASLKTVMGGLTPVKVTFADGTSTPKTAYLLVDTQPSK